MVKHNFKIGDVVVITSSGGGTTTSDIGLICKIVDNNAKHRIYANYTIEIDKIKKGNNDKLLHPNYIRLATSEEIIRGGYKQNKTKTYELW